MCCNEMMVSLMMAPYAEERQLISTTTQYKVLVTGAAGFIGSHVADHCLAQGMDVVATDDLSGGFRDNVPAAASPVTPVPYAATKLIRDSGCFRN